MNTKYSLYFFIFCFASFSLYNETRRCVYLFLCICVWPYNAGSTLFIVNMLLLYTINEFSRLMSHKLRWISISRLGFHNIKRLIDDNNNNN